MKENYVFLCRKKNDDRDCCVYILNKPLRWECGHYFGYFGSVILTGNCFSKRTFPDYDDIETILTREEYQQLVDFSREISELGYCIEKKQ